MEIFSEKIENNIPTINFIIRSIAEREINDYEKEYIVIDTGKLPTKTC